MYASNLKTQTVEKGVIEDSITTKGIIVKNEKVYSSQAQGKVKKFFSEGDRVGTFMKILELDYNDKSSELELKLSDIENALKDAKAVKDNNIKFTSDIKKNNVQIEDLIYQIRSNLMRKNYRQLNQLKKELEVIIGRRDSILGNNTLLNNTIESLEEEKKEILDQINRNSKIYYSDTCGLVSYKIDGLEEIYNAKNILSYEPKDFKVIDPIINEIDDNKNVNFGQPLFKIIDNYEWYVIVKIPNSSIRSLEIGKDVLLEFDNNEIIKSRIINMNSDENDTLLVLKNTDYLYKFYNERYVDIRIIINKYEGLKIPIKSIIKKNGVEGVYIEDISGIVKFRPVIVLAKDEEYAIVEEGNIYGYIEIGNNGNKVKEKTVKLYDEVFINTNNLKEGQIIGGI